MLEAARANGIDLESSCGGNAICSSCHCVLTSGYYDSLPAVKDNEIETLELAHGLTSTSRLGCQIVVSHNLNDQTVYIPSYTKRLHIVRKNSIDIKNLNYSL